MVWVFVGGMLGAMARFGVGQWIGRRVNGSFPFATLAVNISGAFILGWLSALPELPAPFVQFGEMGWVGAYTTFSTLSYETYRLIESRLLMAALFNPLLSLTLGLGAVFLGQRLGGAF